MNDEIRVPVSLPLDSDGFLRRECPTCEREFKWFSHQEGDSDAEIVDQYFCPLCGVPAGTASWWTPAQLDYMNGVASPAIEQYVQDSLDQMLKGMNFRHTGSSSSDAGAPDSLAEPNDMSIAEPPCHPNEPVKVPVEQLARVHCLVCGLPFAV